MFIRAKTNSGQHYSMDYLFMYMQIKNTLGVNKPNQTQQS